MSRLTDFFYENARKYSDKTAVWCDGQAVTYREFADMVSAIANMMYQHGICQDCRIGIPMDNSITSCALFFAAAEIGAAVAPINPTLPAEAIEASLNSVDASCIIAQGNFYKRFQHKSAVCFCLDDSQSEGTIPFSKWVNCSTIRPQIQVPDESTLILTLTSGSTGAPKPIELSQRNKIERAFAHVRLYGLTEEDVILAATPLYHSLAERLVIIPLLIGATTILMPEFKPVAWLNCVAQQKVTFTIAVSAQLNQVAQLLSSPFLPDINSMRCLVSSSALLETHVKRELIRKLHCQFHEMYGTSEMSTVTSIDFAEAGHKTNSVGRCLDEAEIIIVDECGNRLPAGEIGEILCRSTLACKGYYGMSEKTREAYTEDGFFYTGDMGKLDEDGYLYFCGRKQELIKTDGINVYPMNIERCLSRLNGVAECAAFSYPDRRMGEVVAVAVVRNPFGNLEKADVLRYCAESLADFQRPSKVFFLDAMPKNAMGKLVKGKLYEAVRIMSSDTRK